MIKREAWLTLAGVVLLGVVTTVLDHRLAALETRHAEPATGTYIAPSDAGADAAACGVHPANPAFQSGREPWTETERHIRVGDPADLIGRKVPGRCSVGLESLGGGR